MQCMYYFKALPDGLRKGLGLLRVVKLISWDFVDCSRFGNFDDAVNIDNPEGRCPVIS